MAIPVGFQNQKTILVQDRPRMSSSGQILLVWKRLEANGAHLRLSPCSLVLWVTDVVLCTKQQKPRN